MGECLYQSVLSQGYVELPQLADPYNGGRASAFLRQFYIVDTLGVPSSGVLRELVNVYWNKILLIIALLSNMRSLFDDWMATQSM